MSSLVRQKILFLFSALFIINEFLTIRLDQQVKDIKMG